MNWQDLRESLLRMSGLFGRNRRDRELAEELEFHLAQKQQKYMQTSGLVPQQANTQARRDLGGLERWKEACRDVARFRPVEEFGRDLLLAARLLRKTPVFALVAIFTLTAAIGANTAIFSLLNAILLKPLALPRQSALRFFASSRMSLGIRSIIRSIGNLNSERARYSVRSLS